MKILPITKLPTPSLHEPSVSVNQTLLATPEIQEFIENMVPTMYANDGIGLAAPQVARNIQICIVGKDAHKTLKKDLVLVNPTFERISRRTNVDTEGCLSVPRVFGKVKRFTDIAVTAWNEKGEKLEFEAHKFFARVIQHEIDHLNGILCVDKATDMYTMTEEEHQASIKEIKKERKNTT